MTEKDELKLFPPRGTFERFQRLGKEEFQRIVQ